MPDLRRRNCQSCEKSSDDVGNISWSGLCENCGNQHVAENIIGLMTKTGEPYQHWARRSFMAARRALVALDQTDA